MCSAGNKQQSDLARDRTEEHALHAVLQGRSA